MQGVFPQSLSPNRMHPSSTKGMAATSPTSSFSMWPGLEDMAPNFGFSKCGLGVISGVEVLIPSSVCWLSVLCRSLCHSLGISLHALQEWLLLSSSLGRGAIFYELDTILDLLNFVFPLPNLSCSFVFFLPVLYVSL